MQQAIADELAAVDAERLAALGRSWTAALDGRVVGAGGIIPIWRGRASCWLLASRIPQRYWPRLVRRMRRALDEAHADGFWRLEAATDVGFAAGDRLLRRFLGFEIEGMAAWYTPQRADNILYARLDRSGTLRDAARPDGRAAPQDKGVGS